MKRSLWLFTALLSLWLGLTSCTSPNSTNESAAAGIENYLKALALKNANDLIQASCAEWEEQASVELDSFELVETRLEGLSCQVTGADGEIRLVNCQGKILTSYQGENQEVDLSKNTYMSVQEDGIWKMCGYR